MLNAGFEGVRIFKHRQRHGRLYEMQTKSEDFIGNSREVNTFFRLLKKETWKQERFYRNNIGGETVFTWFIYRSDGVLVIVILGICQKED